MAYCQKGAGNEAGNAIIAEGWVGMGNILGSPPFFPSSGRSQFRISLGVTSIGRETRTPPPPDQFLPTPNVFRFPQQ